MNTFRALCAELLQPLAEYDSANPYHKHRDLIDRASAKLAELEAEFTVEEVEMIQAPWSYLAPAGPTREELQAMAAEFAARTPEEFARAVLARWGRPAQLEPVGPINYEGMPCDLTRVLLRPGYEPGDGSAEGCQLVNQAWWHPAIGCDSLQIVVDNARAVIARLSRPALTSTPVSEESPKPDDLDNNRSTDIKDGAAFERQRICAVIDHTANHLHEIKEIGEVNPALYTFGRIVLRLLSKTVKDLPDFEISFDDESEPTPTPETGSESPLSEFSQGEMPLG
jgi:hypothetical protein